LQVGLPGFNEFPLPEKKGDKTMFMLDLRVKEEYIWPIEAGRKVLMLKRTQPSAWLRNNEGHLVTYPFNLLKHESVLSQIIDPHLYPEISFVRNQILSWRFYHHFRTDMDFAFTPAANRSVDYCSPRRWFRFGCSAANDPRNWRSIFPSRDRS
jgi:predicted ATPase